MFKFILQFLRELFGSEPKKEIPPPNIKASEFNKENDFLYVIEELAYSVPREGMPTPKDRTLDDYVFDRVAIWKIINHFWADGGDLDSLYELYPEIIKDQPELAGYREFIGQLWGASDELIFQIAEAYKNYDQVPIVRKRTSIQDGESYCDLKISLTEQRAKAWDEFYRLLMTAVGPS
jgi:hypothetical protein